jgi:hypothetical protein
MRLPNRNQKVRGEIDRFGGNRECSEMTTARAPDAVVGWPFASGPVPGLCCGADELLMVLAPNVMADCRGAGLSLMECSSSRELWV